MSYAAVVFTSLRAVGSDGAPIDEGGYTGASTRMEQRVEEQRGYLGMDSARGSDGVGVTVSYWRTMVIAITAQRVRAVSRISQMRQEPRRRDHLSSAVIDQNNPPDNPAVPDLDHLHTGLPQPVPT